MVELARRGLLRGFAGILAAPAIVRVASLMPLRGVALAQDGQEGVWVSLEELMALGGGNPLTVGMARAMVRRRAGMVTAVSIVNAGSGYGTPPPRVIGVGAWLMSP